MRPGLNELQLELVQGYGTKILLSCSPLYFLVLSTYSQLRPSRLVGQYFSKAIFPRELYWSQLRSCNRAT